MPRRLDSFLMEVKMVKYVAVAMISLASLVPAQAEAGCRGGVCARPVRAAVNVAFGAVHRVRGLFGRVRDNRPVGRSCSAAAGRTLDMPFLGTDAEASLSSARTPRPH